MDAAGAKGEKEIAAFQLIRQHLNKIVKVTTIDNLCV
jgi:hypothetical protein